MHDGVEFRHARAGVEFIEARVAGHHVIDLPGIGDVGDPVVDPFGVQWHEIEVQDTVTLCHKMGDRVLAGLAGTSREQNAHVVLPPRFDQPCSGWRHSRPQRRGQ